MSWKEDLPTAYRDHGLTVSEGQGWKDFGVGDWAYGIPQAALIHQFVWPPQNSAWDAVSMLTHGYDTGSYFLNPPVANKFLNLHHPNEPDVFMVGGRVAQHAGRGVRAVFDNARADQPPLGDGQNAPCGDDWDGGSFCYLGTEMHHYNTEPFAQYPQLVAMCAADCQVFGWTANRILEHSNHTTRKRDDLISVDGCRLRRDIAAAITQAPEPTAVGDDDMALLVFRDKASGVDYAHNPILFITITDHPMYNLLLANKWITTLHGDAESVNRNLIEWTRGQVLAHGGHADELI